MSFLRHNIPRKPPSSTGRRLTRHPVRVSRCRCAYRRRKHKPLPKSTMSFASPAPFVRAAPVSITHPPRDSRGSFPRHL